MIHPGPTPSPLEYRTPSPEALAALSRDGFWSFICGLACAGTTYLFYQLHTVSPLSPTVFLTFPLVSAVPVLGLSGVSRGVDAIGARRQQTLAVAGLTISLCSLIMLLHTLAHP